MKTTDISYMSTNALGGDAGGGDAGGRLPILKLKPKIFLKVSLYSNKKLKEIIS